MEGYCPVAIVDQQRLQRGRSAYRAKHDGVTYYFSDRSARRTFNADPQRYVPALRGDSVVAYARSRKRIPGSVRFASVHNGRLYLFADEQDRMVFDDNPREYVDADLAAGGDSVVWLVRGDRKVSGSDNYTEVFQGLRYRFASMHDRLEFLRYRIQYAAAAALKKMKANSDRGHGGQSSGSPMLTAMQDPDYAPPIPDSAVN